MSEKKFDDGGPAYPLSEIPGESDAHSGMSLWDYYAGQAMGAALGCDEAIEQAREAAGSQMDPLEAVAIMAGRVADVMIQEKRRREA